ncbi:MAG TPA: IPT/TIG domain-containing protein [Pyrinomonadaceae bacterium]|nr:IPT/TIG domain-containing protein [Pyrinomonadaceae bacterium]
MIKIFEGKTPTERNKIIAAGVLGAMALLAILYNIVGLYPSRKTSVTVKTASPKPTASPRANAEIVAALPNQAEMDFEYTTMPVVYNAGSFYAPDAGRNIFAFYEPPVPTPYVAPSPVFRTPMPVPPPMPVPTPPLLISFVSPQSVYSGSKTFRLEVNGDKFTPDSVILFNGSQLPTTFVSPQQLVADVPSNFISGEGGAIITVATPDGRLSSNTFAFNIQAPPRPQFQYIGMIGRKRANNDTAYFQEPSKPAPFGARLNDVVAGRFRIASISASEVVFEDVSLGFRHKLALYRPAPGQSATNDPNSGGYNPFNQVSPVYNPPQGDIPGIPSNIPRQPPPKPSPADDDDDDGDN